MRGHCDSAIQEEQSNLPGVRSPESSCKGYPIQTFPTVLQWEEGASLFPQF